MNPNTLTRCAKVIPMKVLAQIGWTARALAVAVPLTSLIVVPVRAETETAPSLSPEAAAPPVEAPRSTRPGRSGRGGVERPVAKPAEPPVATETPPSAAEPVPATEVPAASEVPPPPVQAVTPVPADAPGYAPVGLPQRIINEDERIQRRKRMEAQQRAAEEAERQRREVRYKELQRQQDEAGKADLVRRQRQLGIEPENAK